MDVASQSADGSKPYSAQDVVTPATSKAADVPEIEVLQESGTSKTPCRLEMDDVTQSPHRLMAPRRSRLPSAEGDAPRMTSSSRLDVSSELRLKRSRTLPHNTSRPSQLRHAKRSSIRGASKLRAPHSATRHASFKDNDLTSAPRHATDRSLNTQPELHAATVNTVTSLALETTIPLRQSASPMVSRNASVSRGGSQRRQSAWSGEQLRSDFNDVSRKYFNPETQIGVAAVLLFIGCVLLILSFDRPAFAWRVLGAVVLALGALLLFSGGLWLYHQSLLKGRLNNAVPRKTFSRRKPPMEGESFISYSVEPSGVEANECHSSQHP